MELEGASLREESTRLRSQVERLRAEKQASEEQRGEEAVILAALREELQMLRDAERRAKDERIANAQVGKCAEKCPSGNNRNAAIHMIFKHVICDIEFLIPADAYLLQNKYVVK